MSKAENWALGDKIKRHHPLQTALREILMRNKCKKTQPFSPGHRAMGMRGASRGSHAERVRSEHLKVNTQVPFQTVMPLDLSGDVYSYK